jgi:uncharacterized protein YciI
MKTRFVRVVLLLVVFTGMIAAQTREANPLAPYIPKNMKPYYLDMLVKGEKHDLPMTAAEKIQIMEQHLGYIRSQVEAGKFVLVGPLEEENRLRGIAVIQADSLEEAQKIAGADPAVQMGHLQVEVHPVLLEDLASVRFDYPASK